MQIIKSVVSLLLFLLPLAAFSQSSYLLNGSKDYILLDRLEIKSGLPNLNFSTIKPYNRRLVTKDVELIDSLHNTGDSSAIQLTDVDKYNIEHFLMNNSEWATPRESFISKKPVLKELYKTKGNLYEVNTKDFFLAVNPLFTGQVGYDRSNVSQSTYYNSRGISARGIIGGRIGFSSYFTENQERDPLYVQQFIASHSAVPGMGYYKPFKKNGVDYFDVRGSISFNVAKYVDVQLGYDKNFIGTGYRSLFLSDFSNNAAFLKFNTRIWKFNYENLFMELVPQYHQTNVVLPRKYFRMNHLSVNATKWLNIGLFDAVMFGRKDHFDFLYLVPVLFLRPAEQMAGSPDNAFLGFDAKANIRKTVQVYGQLLFDEFKLSEITKNTGWWANKYGYQLGIKYIDAFDIKNLDLQLEDNRVRPFTYSHFDSTANYTHYNQPFAHPLGANFQEWIAIAKYQPLKKLYLQTKLIHFYQGLDSGGKNMGSNPFLLYTTRSREYGYTVGGGNKATCTNMTFLASYELRENLFIEGFAQRRTYKTALGAVQNSTLLSLGLRWNMARRDFDF